uniref:Uncharacterized protein n=1 Tax=Anguilla anguilla TaxID=7936 RepID=A0A0E9QY44_ANGAN
MFQGLKSLGAFSQGQNPLWFRLLTLLKRVSPFSTTGEPRKRHAGITGSKHYRCLEDCVNHCG